MAHNKVSSPVEICNLALTRIDQNTISELNDSTLQGRKCGLVYEHCKTSLLAQYNWSFAIKNDQLKEVTPVGVSEYKHKYALPGDYLRLVSVSDGNNNVLPPMSYGRKTYAIEGNALFTDASGVILKYVYDIDTVPVFSALFIDALKLSIAIELTKMFNASASFLQQLQAEYVSVLAKATSVDCQQSVLNPIRQYPLLSMYRSAI